MAHSHTPRNSCVRFVFGIAAASRNTRLQAARCDLTWAGLAPADRASFAGAFPHSITSSARASSVGGTVEAEGLGGLEIDRQLVLGRRLHRQIGRLLALEDAVDVEAERRTISTESGP